MRGNGVDTDHMNSSLEVPVARSTTGTEYLEQQIEADARRVQIHSDNISDCSTILPAMDEY